MFQHTACRIRAEPGPAEICRAIQADIAEYLATDHPCPCPYNRTRRGTACGRLSAWAKPAGRTPRCYAGDVTGELAPNRRGEAVRTAFPPPPSCP